MSSSDVAENHDSIDLSITELMSGMLRGEPKSLFIMGMLLMFGTGSGLTRDPEKGKALIKQAADAGHESAAMHFAVMNSDSDPEGSHRAMKAYLDRHGGSFDGVEYNKRREIDCEYGRLHIQLHGGTVQDSPREVLEHARVYLSVACDVGELTIAAVYLMRVEECLGNTDRASELAEDVSPKEGPGGHAAGGMYVSRAKKLRSEGRMEEARRAIHTAIRYLNLCRVEDLRIECMETATAAGVFLLSIADEPPSGDVQPFQWKGETVDGSLDAVGAWVTKLSFALFQETKKPVLGLLFAKFILENGAPSREQTVNALGVLRQLSEEGNETAMQMLVMAQMMWGAMEGSGDSDDDSEDDEDGAVGDGGAGEHASSSSSGGGSGSSEAARREAPGDGAFPPCGGDPATGLPESIESFCGEMSSMVEEAEGIARMLRTAVVDADGAVTRMKEKLALIQEMARKLQSETDTTEASRNARGGDGGGGSGGGSSSSSSSGSSTEEHGDSDQAASVVMLG